MQNQLDVMDRWTEISHVSCPVILSFITNILSKN